LNPFVLLGSSCCHKYYKLGSLWTMRCLYFSQFWRLEQLVWSFTRTLNPSGGCSCHLILSLRLQLPILWQWGWSCNRGILGGDIQFIGLFLKFLFHPIRFFFCF
jgi:hypothetical protein